MQILSVNVGRPRATPGAELVRTSIDKRPVTGPVPVRFDGFHGDQVSDPRHHGGPDKAVYAFAREDLDRWGERLGSPLRDGAFGENLTTHGIDVNEAEVGERWRVGTALLEVRSVRTPCDKFRRWMGELGHDSTAWVRRFAAEGRPGPYLRVLEEGTLGAGDRIVVAHRPGHGVTVSTMFRALVTDRRLLPELLRAVDHLPEQARHTALASVGQR